MNIISVLVDSFNKDVLKTYNPDSDVRCPNLEAFAARACIFENHFVGSLPCMPARREIMSGRKDFLWRPWGPMEVFDDRLASHMAKGGYRTGIVTDHYHYWEEEANGYVEDFESITFVRGHELDRHKLATEENIPPWVGKMMEYRREGALQYYANVKNFEGEEDYFPARVFTEATEWLDKNAGKTPFYLHIESFDVHEPFDVPEPYASQYLKPGERAKALKQRYNIWPPYQKYDDLSRFFDHTDEAELDFIRTQYKGKASMVDHWFGKLMNKLDELDLWDDTVVVFTTDHGHDLGERGGFGKQYPHYDSHANIPLMVWHPAHPGAGQRVESLTQTVDLFATLLDLAGLPCPASAPHSRSFLPSVVDSENTGREAILYGTFGQGICITDGEWTLFRSPAAGKPLHAYSSFIARPLLVDNPVDGRVGKMPEPPSGQGYFDGSIPYPLWQIPVQVDPRSHEHFLFNRRKDPAQHDNLWQRQPETRDRLLEKLRGMMCEEGAPDEQFDRLQLN
ncbi:sulfatase [Salinicola corii]|uniref:Sulfatase n=1 Tax=Salinicola corii TaxID=2606937 RepID=A0A640WGV1_9GAMM|nr:sulfatase [Salinicola corii]KAA0019640.1 sulfatase [Salinicola corii]